MDDMHAESGLSGWSEVKICKSEFRVKTISVRKRFHGSRVLGGQPASHESRLTCLQFLSLSCNRRPLCARCARSNAIMKRTSVEEGSSPKRPHLDDNLTLFDETRRKNATELLDPATDETNNIEAKVHMIFPCIGKTRQVNVEMHEHGDTYRILVLISSKVDDLLPFPFAVRDRICLSLKGAQIRPRAQSSAPFYLPVTLVFKDGIAAMLMSGPSAGKIFSTWEGEFPCCVVSTKIICIDTTFLTSSRLV
jgi:hypothetical protein